jgi:hypothetical protein
MAFAFLRFEVSLGQEPAETSISSAIRRIGESLETIDGYQARSGEQLDGFSFFPFAIGAHHAGKTIAIGDADGGKA